MASLPADRLFLAFADPTRLRLLHLLRRGEVCVGDLVAALGLPQPKVSRHLAILRSTGLVGARSSARWRYYRLLPATDELHQRLVACLDDCFGAIPAVRRDAERLRRRIEAGGCCAPYDGAPAGATACVTPRGSRRATRRAAGRVGGGAGRPRSRGRSSRGLRPAAR